jgi:dual-specificity kinase
LIADACLFSLVPPVVLQAQAFAKQLLESVAYMHETGLVHTDLKPENILVTSQDLVKEPGSGSSSK